MFCFDSIRRCNIYNNFSEGGCDIYHPNSSIPLNIILDTFSVLQPDRYHIETIFETMPDSNYYFTALHAKVLSTESDLYVNPEGNDDNDGLTPSNPSQILYGSSYYPEDTCELFIYNSLIEDGQEGILNLNPNDIFYYDPSNLGIDPLWDTASLYPYSLSESSPCINTGTLDLPPGIELPEYDLAGNPRVWGSSVDMGAYEYGPWVSVKENPNSTFNIQHSTLLKVSPNPFSYGTYVSYELKENGRVNISVYSISGMKVKTLVNNTGSVGDKGSFYWDGSDQNGQALPVGVYFIRMTMDGKEIETIKVVIE